MSDARPQARTRLGAALGSALFLLVAPGTVAGWIPWAITRWQLRPPLFAWTGMRWLGIALVAAGLVALLDSFARFALEGLGTPAPVLPPTRFVASGLYRHVRNPMYVAVLSLIVGQAALLGSSVLLGYAALVALMFSGFVLLYEEPALRRRFGKSYAAYCAGVPRFWPRLTPWRGEAA